ncbi:5'-AMP-activated_protein kinase [Hexamita inflata]|uniref:Gamma-1 subunit n=1 Tax=Hexamita inflata TaxID=28002 RepID=A0AA86QA00_9EUKA|nr:5'-AMP-activated protein kinase [Hexamita inflata]
MTLQQIQEQAAAQQNQKQFDQLPIQQQFPTVIEFFKQFTAYHLMPTSARVLTIDADTSVYRAFRIMGDNSVSSAYVWDRNTQLYTSVLTATDIMNACIIVYNTFFSTKATHDPIEFARRNNIQFEKQIGIQDLLQHISIGTVKRKQQLILTHTNTTLYDAIDRMVEKNVHRLPVIDNDGSIVLSLTYRQICRFLVSKFRFNSTILQKTVIDAGVAIKDFCTVDVDYSVYDTIQTLLKNNLSMVPVLNKDGRLYDVFSKYDFQTIGNSGVIDLEQKVTKIIDERPAYVEGCITMPVSCTIGQLLRQIADKNLHRMMLVDDKDEKKLVAVVSLRHVLKYLTKTEIYEEDQQIGSYQSIAGSLKNSLQQFEQPASSMRETDQLPEDDQDWRLFQRLNADEQY